MVKEKSNPVKKTSSNKKSVQNNLKTKNIIKEKTEEINTELVKELKKEYKKYEKDTLNNTKINKSEYYDILEHEKSHFLLKFILFILIIFLTCFAIYKLVIRDPKNLFSSSINSIYKDSIDNINKINNMYIFDNDVNLNGVLTISSTDKNYKDLSNYSYDVNIASSKSKNIYKLGIGINNSNNNLISKMNYYYTNNNYYLELPNYYDKIIKLNNPINNIDNRFLKYNHININTLNNSIKEIKNILLTKIPRDKLKKGYEDFNNKKLEYVYLKLNKEEYSQYISKIIDDIKNNNSIIDNLSYSFNTNNDTVLKNLDDILKNIIISDHNNIELKFYYDEFIPKTVGFKFIIDDKEIIYYSKLENIIRINYNEYNITVNSLGNNKYNIDILKDNNDYLKLNVHEFSNTLIDFDYKFINNDNYGNFHLQKYDKDADKGGNLKYSIVTSDNTSSFNFDYVYDKDVNINNNFNYIDINNLDEDTYIDITKKVKDNYKNTYLEKIFINILESLLNY